MSRIKEKKDKQYKCQLCARIVDTRAALMHIKAEEYLLDLIKKDHPQWQNGSKACDKCLAYYRRLVKDAEI